MLTIANVTTAEQLMAANLPHFELVGGDALPGFSMPVAKIFA
jgi:hypothetical protein